MESARLLGASSSSSLALSFVIPALNEAAHIGRTIASIRRHAGKYSYEIIVVDNGSTDETVRLAQQAGARVLSLPVGTIAAVRNHGVRHASGQVLVLLDADASLTSAWEQQLPASLSQLTGATLSITGSHCSPPDHCSWIERYWFHEFATERDVSHLGSGHMLLTRELFLQLGGFDESFETGEDYEFCMRARALGAKLINEPRLRVIHHDFPRTLQRFVRREAWHGRGDLQSMQTFLQSKVALGTVVFLLAHLLVLVGLLLPGGAAVSGFGLLLLAALLVASVWRKFRHAGWRSRLVNTGLFYAYYLGRSAALLQQFRWRRARTPSVT